MNFNQRKFSSTVKIRHFQEKDIKITEFRIEISFFLFGLFCPKSRDFCLFKTSKNITYLEWNGTANRQKFYDFS